MSAANLFRIVHIIWAIVSAIACVILVTSKGGHPPAIILLPIAVIFWVVGHLLVWSIAKLFGRGKTLDIGKESHARKWPLSLLIVAVLLGGVFVFGAMAIILLIAIDNDWLSDMPAILALWLPPSLCFIGILLRQPWSRVLVGWGFIAVAMFVFYQLVETAMRVTTNSMTEWIVAIVIALLALFVGQHVLRSAKIKLFYAKRPIA